MKTKALFIFALLAIMVGCEKDDDDYSPGTYPNEEAIYYQNSEETVFREFLFILKPYMSINNQKRYLAIDSLSNVSIKINNKNWGSFTSLQVDPSLFDTEQNNNTAVTDDQVKYSVIAPYQTSKDKLTTAGEYSKLLNNKFTIEPGFYIFEIKSFEFIDSNGETKQVNTPIVEAIEVTENSRNVFVGEFEIKVN